LRKEHKLKVFDNNVLRKIFGPRRGESGEDYITSSFMICTATLNIIRGNNSR
jgi:hypothetical protein